MLAACVRGLRAGVNVGFSLILPVGGGDDLVDELEPPSLNHH